MSLGEIIRGEMPIFFFNSENWTHVSKTLKSIIQRLA
jgi:hypothetical protein